MDKFLNKIKSTKFDVFFIVTFVILIAKFSIFIGFITITNAGAIEAFNGFFNIASYAIFIIFTLGYLSIAFLFKNRSRGASLIVLNLIMSIILLGDLWYYRGFNSFLSLHLLKETTNLDNLQDSIFAMVHKEDVMFIIDLIVITVVYIFSKNTYKSCKRNVKLFGIFMIVAILYIPTSIKIFHNYTYSYWVGSRWNPIYTMKRISPIGYHVYDSMDFFSDLKPLALSKGEKAKISSWYKNNKENLPDNKYKGMFKGKNLLVIQVESLENFVINQKINGQEVTPNLNKLLNNSIYFSNYHENVNLGVSSDADLMTNTSLYPVRRGSTFFRFPDNKYNSLPDVMGKYGYYSMAIHPDKAMYWNWMPALSAMGGFDKTIDSSHFNEYEKINLGISDGAYLKQLEPMIVSEKKPFYDFVVTLTNHTPFVLPTKYRELKLDNAFDSTEMGGYMQCIHYTDKQIGIFLDNLKKAGVLQNTVVVIYGDHTGIHKYFQSEIPKMSGVKNWMINDEMKIPLIIYDGDGKMQGEEKTVTGGQIDLMPTILYTMGVDKKYYMDTVMGRNLLNTKKDYDLLTNGKILGNPSLEDKKHLSGSFNVSDDIIQGQYYGVKK
ncbi:LTA synthase family protein [Clostridium felsineum]|uniref:LTA synthase family protein n=1 Tax=Clostridium felsineum TaxID=36839 RepID=UPI00098BD60B|nr:LTA synthase family protein [Clostridium felsineum]URZ17363.1 Lipoteichoic acid synthase 1 [Clostridium felsineum DSM 794]